MLKEIAKTVSTYIDGSYGATGRIQGAVVACALCLGCFKVVRITHAVTWFFWRQFLRPSKNLNKYGSWAAVTGATDGIGRACCDVLAKQGMNVLLISRSESRLKAAAEEVVAAYGVETKMLVMDLVEAGNASCEGPQWAAFKAAIQPLNLGVFINNAGQINTHFFMHELPASEVDNLVAINCAAVVKAAHAVLPGMVARGKGSIVNISSVAGTPEATPLLSLYGATKAFVTHFSLSLAAEYGPQGVDVQAVEAGFVATKMVGGAPSLDTPTPARYVAAVARHIGYETLAVPYFKHAMDRPIYQLPAVITTPVIKATFMPSRAKNIAEKAAADKTD